MARLKTEMRVAAMVRRAQSGGAFAAILRRGDPDAGALWIILRQGQALFRYREEMRFDGGRQWFREGPFVELDLNTRTNKAVDRDPDLWIVEIEDAQGRAFLDGEVAKPLSSEPSASELAAKALFRDR